MEYARNVLGIADAHHKEANPDSAVPFISPLSCALIGEQRTVWIAPDTMVGSVYEKGKVVEQFNCSYGLNEAFRNRLGNSAFKISGVDDQNEVRIVELTDHRFFVATLYMPQLSSTQQAPHPLIVSFLKAAVRFKRNRQQMMDE